MYEDFLKDYSFMLGQKFGRLTVIERAENKPKGRSYEDRWLCQCECGAVKNIRGYSLRSGATKSCGCLHRENVAAMGRSKSIDMTGQRFGKLTVIERDGSYIAPNGRTSTRWRCQCDCGAFVSVTRSSLLRGTQSCGCIRSLGEKRIAELLNENHIRYKKEYIIPGLNGASKHGPLRFDFGILNDNQELQYLIEYDGEQHFHEAGGTWEALDNVVERDERKNNYCVKHNIPLIRIPYTVLDNLKIEDIMPGSLYSVA